MATATWIAEELKQKHIPYQELHHPDAYTAQELAQREHVSGHRVAKVVGVMADNHAVEAVLPASRRVNLDRMRDVLGARDVRLATERELVQCFSDCEPGAIPPLRHWRDVDVIMDGNLRTAGDIVIPAGTHRDAIRMNFDDWFEMVQPRVELISDPADPGRRQEIV
jgi:Ala-tRNA(Pro) deacylase